MTRHKTRPIDLTVLLGFIGLTLFLTRPWIAHPFTTSIGYSRAGYGELPNGDIMLSVGFSGWLGFAPTVLHQWPLAQSTYLMYPCGASHGTSFDGLLSGLVTAGLGLVMPLLLAHDLAMLLGIFLCGWVCYRLGVKLWGRGLTSVAVGLSALCMPYLLQRAVAHPNLVYIWTVPLAMLLFLNLTRRPTWKRAGAWAISFPLLAASSWYILIMGLAAQSAVTLAVLARERFSPRSLLLRRLAAGWAAGLALIATVGWPMISQYHERVPIATDSLAQYSVPLAQFAMPFPGSVAAKTPWARQAQARIGADWEAYAGGPIAALGLMLVYFLWRRPGGPRLALALLAAAGLFLAVGPYLSVTHLLPAGQGLKMPLYYLGRLSGAFNVVRIPGRMHPLLNFAALFASGAMLQHWRRHGLARGRAARLAWPVLAGAYLALNLAWSVSFGPSPVFKNIEVPQFYRDLGRKRGKGAVMDVPISYYQFAYYNYYQFFHKRPITSPVLFHDALPKASREFVWKSSIMPFFMDGNRDFVRVDVVRKLVQPAFIQGLARQGVAYVVVHKEQLRFLSDRKMVHPDTAYAYQLIETAWRPRLVYEDGWIRAYTTDPKLPLAPVKLPGEK